MTNDETHKKLEIQELRERIKIFNEIIDHYSTEADNRKRNIDRVTGVALGLFLGIAGNLAVQHWFPMFEGFVNNRFDTWFYQNTIVFLIALAGVIYFTVWFRRELRWNRGILEDVNLSINVTKHEIEDLEQRKTNLETRSD